MLASQVARGPRRKGKPARGKGRAKSGGGGGAGPIALAGALCAAGVAILFGFRKKSQHVLLDHLRDRAVLDEMLDKPISYTDHAHDRMDCRHISTQDVLDSLRLGLVNRQKSDFELLPCPKIVVDASVGTPSKRVQNVFTACPAYTGVVTVIDQDTNWTCM